MSTTDTPEGENPTTGTAVNPITYPSGYSSGGMSGSASRGGSFFSGLGNAISGFGRGFARALVGEGSEHTHADSVGGNRANPKEYGSGDVGPRAGVITAPISTGASKSYLGGDAGNRDQYRITTNKVQASDESDKKMSRAYEAAQLTLGDTLKAKGDIKGARKAYKPMSDDISYNKSTQTVGDIFNQNSSGLAPRAGVYLQHGDYFPGTTHEMPPTVIQIQKREVPGSPFIPGYKGQKPPAGSNFGQQFYYNPETVKKEGWLGFPYAKTEMLPNPNNQAIDLHNAAQKTPREQKRNH